MRRRPDATKSSGRAIGDRGSRRVSDRDGSAETRGFAGAGEQRVAHDSGRAGATIMQFARRCGATSRLAERGL
jgi:hypothetical protein